MGLCCLLCITGIATNNVFQWRKAHEPLQLARHFVMALSESSIHRVGLPRPMYVGLPQSRKPTCQIQQSTSALLPEFAGNNVLNTSGTAEFPEATARLGRHATNSIFTAVHSEGAERAPTPTVSDAWKETGRSMMILAFSA